MRCLQQLHSVPFHGALLGLLLVCLAGPVHAEAMRCGNKLVVEGDSRLDVRAKCGAPVDIERRTILRQPIYRLRGQHFFYGDALVEVPVELWTYNFGPNQFMRRLHIVDGEVEEIEILGYGYYAR